MKYSPRVTSGLRPCVIDWPREHTHTSARNTHHTGVHDAHTKYMHERSVRIIIIANIYSNAV